MSIYRLNSSSLSSMIFPVVVVVSASAALTCLSKKIYDLVYHKFFSAPSKDSVKNNVEVPPPQSEVLPLIDPTLFRPSQLFDGKSPPSLSLLGNLKQILGQATSLTLVDIDGIERKISLLKYLGHGRDKYAIDIGNGDVLFFPNMDASPIEDIQKAWEPMALHEVYYSKLLQYVGLLSPLSEVISLKLSDQDTIAIYRSKSFQWLAEKENIFVIDMRNRDSSTWKKGENFLFSSEEERLSEEKWMQSLDSLWSDIAILCLYGIPLSPDSKNFAVVKDKDGFAQIRLFGFDFSSKQERLLPPQTLMVENYCQKMKDLKEKLSQKKVSVFTIKHELDTQLRRWEKQAETIVETGLPVFFHYEFPKNKLGQSEIYLLENLIWQSRFKVGEKIKQRCPEFFENKALVDFSNLSCRGLLACSSDKHECID